MYEDIRTYYPWATHCRGGIVLLLCSVRRVSVCVRLWPCEHDRGPTVLCLSSNLPDMFTMTSRWSLLILEVKVTMDIYRNNLVNTIETLWSFEHDRDCTVVCTFNKLGRPVNHFESMDSIDFGGQGHHGHTGALSYANYRLELLQSSGKRDGYNPFGLIENVFSTCPKGLKRSRLPIYFMSPSW